MKRAFGYRTEQRKRSENQDCYGVFDFPGFTLAIVCDGMGGHVGGAQASTLAVRTVHEAMGSAGGDLGEALRIALERANQVIYEAARKNHRLMGMGTTAVAAVITEAGTVHIAHVGDSRAYLINEGQAIQVTRDHTMVNLFVDAELLTPEDAATHPEAHVLSRSLGVERQVEVELSEPIELADRDVVFLCSDGIHGVVTDWELGSVDWASPASGVSHVLDIVAAREGDDNATAVCVLIGDGDSMPASPLPEPKSLEASFSHGPGAGITLLPSDHDTYDAPGDPDSHGTEPSAPPREGLPFPDLMPTVVTGPKPGAASPVPQATPGPTAVASPEEATRARAPAPIARPPQKGGTSPLRVIVPAAAVLLLGMTGLLVVFAMLRPIDDGDVASELVVNLERPKPIPTRVEVPSPVDTPPPSNHFFAPNVPAAPRRLPHRPLRFTQPPPPGASQFQAVQAARDAKCGESLEIVQKAMKISPDHAKLYSQTWFCFGETHSRPLMTTKVDTWKDFRELERHFRGWPVPGEPEIVWTADEKKLPIWYRPARGGVELRLEAWQRSNDDDQLREVIVDLKGEPSVADDLAVDLLVEAQAAVALSKAMPRDAEVEEAWSRRVFVTASALAGRAGRMIRTHRPELAPQIEALLDAATTQAEGQPPVPAGVSKALKVGRGEEPPPTIAPVRVAPVNVLPDEPDLGTGQGGPSTIHR